MPNLLCLILVFFLLSCSKESKQNQTEILTIQHSDVTNHLFYAGSIQPLRTWVVTSPVDGTIVDMSFQYGEAVKPSQVLFSISSTKFLSDYKTALMQYVKAKSDFNNAQTQFSEAAFLHKHELISDDDFKMRQANFYAGRLALFQAKDTLEDLLKQLNIKNIDLNKLSIADMDKITQALHIEKHADSMENLRVLAPTQGIVLSASKNEEENKKILKGDVVKQGDVLAIIGDMQGLTVRIKVNELTVNQLKVGQKVAVTGIAFEEILTGQISRVDKQGELSAGGQPTFAVEIIVPHLTFKQQEQIHVGMSAKVAINLSQGQQIVVPIKTLFEKNGISFVKKYDQTSKKIQEVMVKTGQTTNDAVTILNGLKPGDQIVIPN